MSEISPRICKEKILKSVFLKSQGVPGFVGFANLYLDFSHFRNSSKSPLISKIQIQIWTQLFPEVWLRPPVRFARLVFRKKLISDFRNPLAPIGSWILEIDIRNSAREKFRSWKSISKSEFQSSISDFRFENLGFSLKKCVSNPPGPLRGSKNLSRKIPTRSLLASLKLKIQDSSTISGLRTSPGPEK